MDSSLLPGAHFCIESLHVDLSNQRPPGVSHTADKDEPNREGPKEEPKKEMAWWLALLIGVGMLVGSVFVYFDLTKFEEQGGERRMHWLAVLLYKWLGKWGLVGLIALIGLAMTVFGIVLLCNKLAGPKELEEVGADDDEERPRRRRRPPAIDEEDEEPRPRRRPPPIEDEDEDRPRPKRRPRGDD
jgi:hypothetical protein